MASFRLFRLKQTTPTTWLAAENKGRPSTAQFMNNSGQLRDVGAEAHYLFADEHHALRQSIRSWVGRAITPHIDEWEQQGNFPRSVFAELGDRGFLGLQYPEQYGGQGGDLVSAIILCEELSYVGAESVSMAVAVHTGMAVPPILRFGTESQRQRYLPGLISGHLVAALAISEPDAGSDVTAILTRATRYAASGGWILNGRKTFITNGDTADLVLVMARTADDGPAHARFSIFLVDASAPGFIRGRRLVKIGRLASDTSELVFEDLHLPADALVGEPGKGFQHLMWELDVERLFSAATSVALAYRALTIAVDYCHRRIQFGKPIADFQALRHHLADLASQLAAARELVYFSVWRFMREAGPVAEVAMAKLVAADVLNRTADYALQVHGGWGYIADYPISRIWKDARLKRISAGTDEIMREIIAKNLMGRPSRHT